MKTIIGICIFCLVLFIYLHIMFHFKISDDLEMYDLEYPSKDKLEELCDLRQPVLFDFDSQKIEEYSNKKYISEKYPSFEVKIRNIKEEKEQQENTISDIYIPLQLQSSIQLFDGDKNASYFSEKNKDFLIETGLIKVFKYNDNFLKPYMVSNCNYDIIMGTNETTTPFKYELNYRNYFLLTQGTAQIKLTPPKNKKYLHTIYDYDNFEFKSPINPWSPQAKYKHDFDKVKCLEFTLLPGKTLFVPAYWWYSIKFNENTSISCFYYRTYMNNVSIIPQIGMHFLQIQNITRKPVKKIIMEESNDNEIHEQENVPDKIQEKQYINDNETNINVKEHVSEDINKGLMDNKE